MEKRVNRVADGLVKWMQTENEMRQDFGKDIDKKRHFQVESLRYYNHLQKTYAKTKDPDEKRYLKVLKGEIKELQKKVYPNRVVRNFVKGAELLSKGWALFSDAARYIGEKLADYSAKRNEVKREKASAVIKPEARIIDLKTEKNKDQTIGPNRDTRRNNTEIGRGSEEMVRHNRDIDNQLSSKKISEKAQNKSVNGENLLPKIKVNTGKGLKL